MNINTFLLFKKKQTFSLKSMALGFSLFTKISKCADLCVGAWNFSEVKFAVTLKSLCLQNSVAQNFIKVTISEDF